MDTTPIKWPLKWSGGLLSLVLCCPLLVAEPRQENPSIELLEFLAEFDEVDDATFEMMIENGVRDIQKSEIEKIISQDDTQEVGDENDEDKNEG